MSLSPSCAAGAPQVFAFSPTHLARAHAAIACYPAGRQQSAVLPLLHLAQEQMGWVSRGAMECIAQMLDMPPMKVWEAASFYTMFHLKPIGRRHIKVCKTTPCWLRGSDALMRACEEKLGISAGETTADGAFTLDHIECLGACVSGPVLQVNNDLCEGIRPEHINVLIDQIETICPLEDEETGEDHA